MNRLRFSPKHLNGPRTNPVDVNGIPGEDGRRSRLTPATLFTFLQFPASTLKPGPLPFMILWTTLHGKSAHRICSIVGKVRIGRHWRFAFPTQTPRKQPFLYSHQNSSKPPELSFFGKETASHRSFLGQLQQFCFSSCYSR